MFNTTETLRGFTHSGFEDSKGAKCSIQKSSLAFEDCIWFGVNDADPKIMCNDAVHNGVTAQRNYGWQPYEIPKDVLLTTRMHLTQEQVKQIIPILEHFVDTGELPS